MKRSQRKAQVKNKKARQKEARRQKQAGTSAVPEVPVTSKEVVEPAVPDVKATVKQATAVVAEARTQVRHADEVDDATAKGMLARAARMLDKVVSLAHNTLQRLPEKEVREAFAIVEDKPDPSDISAERRPRRGTDPLVTLIKVGVSAASLLKRVLAKTNPELGKLATV